MKLFFLGTGSGTEPITGFRHVSFAIQTESGLYWFDAGEGCAYTAHTSGIDLLSVRAIFISHTHTDHIGGLANLLWTMGKLGRFGSVKGHMESDKTLQLFIPDLEVWDGVRRVVRGPATKLSLGFDIQAERYDDGTIYRDSEIKVSALHNCHLGVPNPGEPWRSFSFRIETDNRVVVFSGDVASVNELSPLLDRCDLLLMETGHHSVEDVCNFLRDSGKFYGKLAFIHHGRAILADPDGEAAKAQRILGEVVLITRDGMTLEI